MARIHIIADENIPFLRGALEPFARVTYLPGIAITRRDLKDADALLVRTRTCCNQELLEDTPVTFIGSTTIGFDHIDTLWCDEQHITWANAPGCNSSSVMQYMASAIVFLCRKFSILPSSLTLGIIGVGNVGSKVERLARALGMKVLLNDPPRERREGPEGFVPLEKICKESDIISFHVPLADTGTDPTLYLCDREFISELKKKPILINTSRGGVVKTSALVQALQTGKIRSAVTDVWEDEPRIDREFLSLADIATPHIAGYSIQGKANGTAMVVRSLSRFFNLPLADWYPDNISLPDQAVIDLSDKKDEMDILFSAIEATYKVEDDSRHLRKSPDTFEKQRDSYPPRHEFTSYRVLTGVAPSPVKKALTDIGFNVT